MDALSPAALDLLIHLHVTSKLPPISWEAASVAGQSLRVRGSHCGMSYIRGGEQAFEDRDALQDLYAAGLVEQLAVSRTEAGEERVYGRAFGSVMLPDPASAPGSYEPGCARAPGYRADEEAELYTRGKRPARFVFARGLRLTDAGRARVEAA